jgi:hypothetical protein
MASVETTMLKTVTVHNVMATLKKANDNPKRRARRIKPKENNNDQRVDYLTPIGQHGQIVL